MSAKMKQRNLSKNLQDEYLVKVENQPIIKLIWKLKAKVGKLCTNIIIKDTNT